MAKVPAVQYNRAGVQSLGRYDPLLPGKENIAQAQLNTTIAGAAASLAKIYEQSKIDEASAVTSDMMQKMSELNEKVKMKKSYTADELDGMGIDYVDTVMKIDENGNEVENFREIIPAYEVADQVYKTQAETIKKTALSNVSGGKATQVVESSFGQLYKQGIGDAIGHNIKHYQEAAKLRMDASYNQAVQLGNEEGARLVAKTAWENGVWTESEYSSHLKVLPSAVAQNLYMRTANAVETVEDVESVKTLLLNDPRFSQDETSRRKIYNVLESKQTRIESATEKKRKQEFEASSANLVVEYTNQLARTKQPYDYEVIQAMDLTPADKKLVNTLNNSLYVESDPDSLRGLTLMVKTIGLPAGKADFAQRRASAVNQLTLALEEKRIGVKDFSTLWDGINKAQAFEYENPDNEVMLEMMWRTLTGGSRNIITEALGEGGVQYQAAIDAELKYREAIRNQGAGFNSYNWWNDNKQQAMLQSTRDNLNDLQDQKNMGYAIEGNNGDIDLKATMDNLMQQVQDNKITQTKAEMIYKSISAKQRLIDKMREEANRK